MQLEAWASNDFWVHFGRHVIVSALIFNGLLRLIYERKIGSYEMHPDSLLFATTNLGTEGVGDIIPPHGRNRITVVQVRRPDHMEFIEWGINNDMPAEDHWRYQRYTYWKMRKLSDDLIVTDDNHPITLPATASGENIAIYATAVNWYGEQSPPVLITKH